MKPHLNSEASAVKPFTRNLVVGIGLIAIGGTLAIAGIYVGETDDAPGAALLGLLLMMVLAARGVQILRRGA